MKHRLLCSLALTLLPVLALAAPPRQSSPAPSATLPTFDVVSIKPNKSGTNMFMSRYMPDGVHVTNAPLLMLIRQAYGLFNANDDQITGLPDWAKNERFDIDAKVNEADLPALKIMKPEQRGLMLQALLADRFQMAAHRETRQLPVYALVVAKGGPRLKPSTPGDTYPNGIKTPEGKPGGGAGMMRMGRGQLDAQAITIASLLSMLTQNVDRTVLDQTGLTGTYDITLRWTPDDPSGAPVASGAPDAPPTLFTALQEQLGLRLEPQKGPVDTVVVEHIEHPTEN